MNIHQSLPEAIHSNEQFHRQYGVNALLPHIDWVQLFKHSKVNTTHLVALETLYQTAIPLALQVFNELNFDVFSPNEYRPQGLGLFEKLAQQETQLLDLLEAEVKDLDHETRLQMWSMLLRGGAVLVFKAWLGHIKLGPHQLDTTQFDELSDLLFVKTAPHQLAQRLGVNPYQDEDHIFLMYADEVYLDRFNCLETAALFVDLGVYDATFLAIRDDRVADYLKQHGYVSDEQIEELQCALNPLFCADMTPKQSCLA
jgi:hypothetical protein